MAISSTLTSAYRDERATTRPARTPLTVRAARAIGKAAARTLPAWQTLRTFTLSAAGLASIDVGLWQWNNIAGWVGAGVGLLVLEALTGGDG